MPVFGQFPIEAALDMNLAPVELTSAPQTSDLALSDPGPASAEPVLPQQKPTALIGAPWQDNLKIELGYAGVGPGSPASQWLVGQPQQLFSMDLAGHVAPLFVHIDLELWRDVFEAEVPSQIVADLDKRDRTVQKIGDGFEGVALDPYSKNVYAPVSLDFYGILIRSLPGRGYSGGAKELLDVLRMEFGTILKETNSRFIPDDEGRWIKSPLGSVLHIDFHTGFLRRLFPEGLREIFGDIAKNLDSGSVVVSAVEDTSWTVHTIFDPKDLAHPLAGVRRWGFVANPDGSYLFYTKAVDRPRQLIDYAVNALVFQGADSLWRAFQSYAADFVNTKGGDAKILPPIRNIFEWSRIKSYFENHTA